MSNNEPLAALLASSGPVLLDFDGPVTPLMPPPRNRLAADAVCDVLRRSSGCDLPPAISDTTDHLAVMRYAYDAHPGDVARAVEHAADGAELAAALDALPTAGSAELLRAFRQARRPVVIVSNNSSDAIATYLDRHHLDDSILAVVGRVPGRPDLMKPSPHSLQRALAILGASADRCVMVGDSVTDILASHAAGVRVIGYAKRPERGLALAAAGADASVGTMTDLAAAAARCAAGREQDR